jgi:hypothetical protein
VARRRSLQEADALRRSAVKSSLLGTEAELATAELATAELATAELATAELATAELATAELATAALTSLSISTEAAASDAAAALDSPDSEPPPELPRRRSLADFLEVHHGVNHAADNNVSLNDAFAALEYTDGKVTVVNDGILFPSTPRASARAPGGFDNGEQKAGDFLSSAPPATFASSISMAPPRPLTTTTRASSMSDMSDAPAAPASAGCGPGLFRVGGSSSQKKAAAGSASSRHTIKAESTPDLLRAKISGPRNVKCVQHVRYNPELARYEGLDASSFSANQQYGVPFASVPKIRVDGYAQRIPAILIMLWKRVLESGGEKAVGIFRLAADKVVMETLKRQMNTGQYNGESVEENVAATLIKIWFRELPTNILNIVDKSLLDRVAGMGVGTLADGASMDEQRAEAAKVVSVVEDGFIQQHKEQEFASFLWLLDVMGQVVAHKAENKMSTKNMAIVVAPNLYSIADVSNPMAAMTWTSRIAQFTEVILESRMLLNDVAAATKAGSADGM